MEDIVYYNDLYDLYGDLLTEKHRKYFEDYYFDNYSFSEMSEHFSVSLNAVFKQIHIVIEKLEEYEKKLKLLEKKKVIQSILPTITDSESRTILENIL